MRTPKYRPHSSGQARVQIDGRVHYLGKYGSPESHAAYKRLVAEKFSEQPGSPSVEQAVAPVVGVATVCTLLYSYLTWARDYYHGEGEYTHARVIAKHMKPWLKCRTRDFSPQMLAAFRDSLIPVRRPRSELCISRQYINRQLTRARRIFRWGVSQGLVPAGIWEALKSVDGLRRGKSDAREATKVHPVDRSVVEATITQMCPTLAAMVQFELLTGCRPEDVCYMRLCEIDRSGPVWVLAPEEHKTAWREMTHEVHIGPKAQAILAPFLGGDPAAYVFSPRQAQKERGFKPRREVADHYTTHAYRTAIGYAIKRTAIDGKPCPHWTPNQLRHTRGTEVRQQYGLEGAQVTLGHAKADVTQIYAERDRELARLIASEIG